MADDFQACPEFDCCECGRHIIQISGVLSDPPTCGACQMVPGWFEDPAARALIDLDGIINPPDLSKVPLWTGGA